MQNHNTSTRTGLITVQRERILKLVCRNTLQLGYLLYAIADLNDDKAKTRCSIRSIVWADATLVFCAVFLRSDEYGRKQARTEKKVDVIHRSRLCTMRSWLFQAPSCPNIAVQSL